MIARARIVSDPYFRRSSLFNKRPPTLPYYHYQLLSLSSFAATKAFLQEPERTRGGKKQKTTRGHRDKRAPLSMRDNGGRKIEKPRDRCAGRRVPCTPPRPHGRLNSTFSRCHMYVLGFSRRSSRDRTVPVRVRPLSRRVRPFSPPRVTHRVHFLPSSRSASTSCLNASATTTSKYLGEYVMPFAFCPTRFGCPPLSTDEYGVLGVVSAPSVFVTPFIRLLYDFTSFAAKRSRYPSSFFIASINNDACR